MLLWLRAEAIQGCWYRTLVQIYWKWLWACRGMKTNTLFEAETLEQTCASLQQPIYLLSSWDREQTIVCAHTLVAGVVLEILWIRVMLNRCTTCPKHISLSVLLFMPCGTTFLSSTFTEFWILRYLTHYTIWRRSCYIVPATRGWWAECCAGPLNICAQ